MLSSKKVYGQSGRVYADDSDIRNSRITRAKVTLDSEPINPEDAVSLSYLQAYTSGYSPFQILQLRGTLWLDVDDMPSFGNRSITINGLQKGSPNGHWRVARETDDVEGDIDKDTFTPRIGPCYLELRWLANSMLQIRKTTDDFDGSYELTISR